MTFADALGLSPAVAATFEPLHLGKRVDVLGGDGATHDLFREGHQVVIDATPEEVWDAFSAFGDIHRCLTAIVDSSWIGEPKIGLGAARSCDIVSPAGVVNVKERIFDFHEGSSFTYDVYAWEKTPLNRMQVTFGIYVDDTGKTVLYNLIDFMLKPAALTLVARGPMRKSAREGVLAMKHFIETGDPTVETAQLSKLYPNL